MEEGLLLRATDILISAPPKPDLPTLRVKIDTGQLDACSQSTATV